MFPFQQNNEQPKICQDKHKLTNKSKNFIKQKLDTNQPFSTTENGLNNECKHDIGNTFQKA